jgi:hypothetical protein
MRPRSVALAVALVFALVHPAGALSKKNLKLFNQLLAQVSASAYGLDSSITIAPGFCNCAQVTCNGHDVRVNCTGGFLPLPGVGGYLTGVGNAPGTFNTCGACGCTVGTSPANLSVAIVCVPSA